jgi:SAM-dependent methyltransferase
MNMTLHHHIELLARYDRGLILKELVKEAVKPGMRVLDAGCGSGLLSVFAAQVGAAEVLGVDIADLSVAESISKANGCEKTIRYLRTDLKALSAKEHGKFDVVLGMVYFNDPRRDEAQAQLAHWLVTEFMAENGRCIPDGVSYLAYPVEWDSQDLPTRLADLDRRVKLMESRYGISLSPLSIAGTLDPNPAWFPQRTATGLFPRSDFRILGEPTNFASFDYRAPLATYPATQEFKITNPGICNGVLFVQNLVANGRTIFSNESLAWIENPLIATPGTLVTAEFGVAWKKSNRVKIRT